MLLKYNLIPTIFGHFYVNPLELCRNVERAANFTKPSSNFVK
jgi:hypothetical protein